MEKNRFIELLTKDLTGEITVDEKRELIYLRGEPFYDRKEEDLLREYWSNSHKVEYDSDSLFKRIQQKIDNGETGEEEITDLTNEPDTSEDNIAIVPLFSWMSRAASVLLIACCTLFVFHSFLTYRKELLVKETPKGVRSVFTLTDGTEIRLNADSRLEYPAHFSDSTREVFLIGEAFFDVSKDAAHPFIIHTKDMDIKVLGTTFNVKAYSNESLTETTLLNGAITVTLNNLSKKQIYLKPSQKLVFRNLRTDKRRVALTSTDIDTSMRQLTYFKPDHATIIETSWTDNKLTFKNEEFAALARSMERWYNVDISFDSENAKQLRFTGIIEKENISEALKALQLTEKFNYTINDSAIRIF
ncbi:FecR family protein [Pedobacter westerhofensis]|uniref:FecR family protein n=1 Tax=Pedobacter westerhofensis TaxID=425512 RepID=A0A521AQ27_9SPHI|nr:FecR domain-containing protein [Pedobacter westerhofensis]SMO36917.1 FecR family protein [Pedobacter westerhofensis]